MLSSYRVTGFTSTSALQLSAAHSGLQNIILIFFTLCMKMRCVKIPANKTKSKDFKTGGF